MVAHLSTSPKGALSSRVPARGEPSVHCRPSTTGSPSSPTSASASRRLRPAGVGRSARAPRRHLDPRGRRVLYRVDVLTGQLAGDTRQIPGDVDARQRDALTAFTLAGVTPRELAAQTIAGNTQVQAGLVTSHWGLGILANDGAHDPLFGLTDRGLALRTPRDPPQAVRAQCRRAHAHGIPRPTRPLQGPGPNRLVSPGPPPQASERR